ncbi:MAG: DUF1499 domain-containing protein [Pseudomonadales bacterium]|nr:DUF1499 domain-containing protein [Pseudomonadales bacterium]
MRHLHGLNPLTATILLATAMFLSGCSGTIPDTLGVINEKLPACPDKPNCVVSHLYDDEHQIDPLTYSGELAAAHAQLVKSIEQIPGSKIITNSERYIHAEFTSQIMRYVDDVEFYFNNEEKIIDLRSASRLGHSDMGVNRERIETLRGFFKP